MARIIVTRMPHQAATLCQLINETGHEAVLFPVLKIEPLNQAEITKKLRALTADDFVVFTSQNTVHRVLESGPNRQFKAISIGPATSQALESYGLKPVIEAADFISSGLFEVIAQQLKDTDRIWLPQSARATNELAEKLATVCEVEHTSVYTVVEAKREPFQFKADDTVVFTSPSAVIAFINLLTAEEHQLLSQLTLLSIGPVTTAVIVEKGLNVAYEAHPYHIEGFRSYFKNQKKV
ncbi:hypothetical protein BFC19_00345 [Brochothrix thermosphacta]|uniref:uroporphyrinogen-III synthase n=1 Tax=Brochothrix thermosphacta TaxID=2756 RepID=UPI000E717F71|nr:uroporphyrinogen-III synthase [Brochothrix thermosphacta]ANZ93983.1 hypothetical protein BFC19_00345 [Brochothrix thermosphacta]